MNRWLQQAVFIVTAKILVLLCAGLALAECEVDLPAEVDVGAPFFLTVRCGPGLSGMDVRWQDRQVRVPAAAGQARVLLGVGLDVPPGAHRIVGEAMVEDRQRAFVREVQVRSKTFPEQRLRVAREMVAPDPSLLPRIEQERRLVRQTLNRVSSNAYWSEPFVRPVGGSVSSVFGLRRFFNDEPRAPHRGVDLRGAEGTPVQAFSAGVVALTGDHYFAGKSVYVDHGLGMITQYIHLSEIMVAEGQTVSAGQVVGKVGATGRVTGPHLHFGLSVLGMWVDPLPLLE